MITSHRDLKVWQDAMALAEAVYRLAGNLPKTGFNALGEQMWRAAMSVPANIAEGYGRESARSYVQFLKIARGSLNELETHVLLARRVNHFDGRQAEALLLSIEAIGKMLNALIKSLARRYAA